MKLYWLKSTDLPIIAVPVYSGRVAPMATRRICKLKGENTPSVLLAVYGNRAYENALVELKDITEPKGFKAIAAAAFIGEHSFNSPNTPIANGRPDSEDIKIAKEFGENIKTKLGLEEIPDLEIPGNHPYREGGKTDRRSPTTDPETCILCGMCARVCSTGSVTVTELVETEINDCTTCAACVKNCPTGARHWEHDGILKAARWLSSEHGIRKEPEIFI